ncbi:MAG: hypothetical protein LJD31_03370, partial [Wolbachia endosymbiont of Menacanthus eurysternus]|nr:hypothetical protein [Wolbachia endosymbiont of Menacanthus eurysternus]
SYNTLLYFFLLSLKTPSKALANAILQNNGELVKKFINIVASDQLKHLRINNSSDFNPKIFVDAVLQNDGEVAKRFIDFIASDQLKHFIINSIDNPKLRVFANAILQNNGEIAKGLIDFIASDDQLRNVVYDVARGESPNNEEVKRIVDFITSHDKFRYRISLGILNEHKGKVAIGVLLTGGAVTAFVLGQPIIGAIAAVAAVIAVSILIGEIYAGHKQQNAGSILHDMTLELFTGQQVLV